MKGLDFSIDTLGLSAKAISHFDAFAAQFAVDGTELSYEELARFVIQARKEEVRVSGDDIDVALSPSDWPYQTINEIGNLVDVIQCTIDTLKKVPN